MHSMLILAGKVAKPTNDTDLCKNYWLGAVGCRSDNNICSAKNMPIQDSDRMDFKREVWAHAEARVLRKMRLTTNGTIYVARISRKNGDFAMSSPCDLCRPLIAAHRIERVFYTINNNEYGVWNVKKDFDKVYRK